MAYPAIVSEAGSRRLSMFIDGTAGRLKSCLVYVDTRATPITEDDKTISLVLASRVIATQEKSSVRTYCSTEIRVVD